MSETKVEHKDEVKNEVRKIKLPEPSEISETLQANVKDVTVVGDTATITFQEGTFSKTLPEGLTEEVVKASIKHTRNLAAGLANATTKVAIDNENGFKNKNVNDVSATIQISKATSVSATALREKLVPTSVPASQGEQVKTEPRFSQVSAKISVKNRADDIKETNKIANLAYEQKFNK